MKALTWHGERDVRVEDVPEPHLVNPHDAIIEVEATAICGSDLHLYHDRVPTMRDAVDAPLIGPTGMEHLRRPSRRWRSTAPSRTRSTWKRPPGRFQRPGTNSATSVC
jgi:hypothetical protein